MMTDGARRPSAFTMNGQLREYPLAELLRAISAEKLSGSLRLSRERVRAVVYAEAGEVVLARSNLRVYRLAECLRRWGVVAPDRLAAGVTESMSEEEVCASLVAAGLVGQTSLDELRARQAAEVLQPLLLWTEGVWEFEPRARLAEDARVSVDLKGLLLESARRLSHGFAASRLSDDGELLSPVTDPPGQFALLPHEGYMLSRLEVPMPLGQLVAASGLPDAPARHALYTLALVSLVTRAGWPQPFTAQARAQAQSRGAAAQGAARERSVQTSAAPPEEASAGRGAPRQEGPPDPLAEADALLTRVSGNSHYELLGVGRAATPPEIKRAYYALAKRFHPDRFPREFDQELRLRLEGAFAQLTQAYETLHDARDRAAYDSRLDAQAPAGGPQGAGAKDGAAPQRGGEAAPSDSFFRPRVDQASAPQYGAEEIFQQGLAAQKAGDDALALARLGEAARLDPRQARFRAHYGRALARHPKTQRQAEAELQAAVSLAGDNPDYRVMLAELYASLGQVRRAAGELERALALSPNHEAARRLLQTLKGKG